MDILPQHPATGLTGRLSPGRFHCQVGREANYIASVKVMVKVLDFVQLGGSDLTVDSTIFEMWLGCKILLIRCSLCSSTILK